MIDPKCLTDSWIVEARSRMKAADPGQLELAIHALDLLCKLQRSGIPFIFKGGTSLLLHLPEIRRLSVDVDIVCEVSKTDFEDVLDKICDQQPFIQWEEDLRGKDRIPRRRHYKVFFPSRRIVGGINRVIIDVLEEPCPLSLLEEKPVQTSFIELQTETRVRVPTVEALLGDKLTAFAPNTVGVPLNDRYAQQVVKQLFDVGELFVVAQDFEKVRTSYTENHASEAAYRSQRFEAGESLKDTLDICFNICQAGLRGDKNPQPDERLLLQQGFRQIANLLVNYRFNSEVARIHASRAARLATHLMTPSSSVEHLNSLHYRADAHLEALRSVRLPESRQMLQRLKAQPEALHHWVQICQTGF